MHDVVTGYWEPNDEDLKANIHNAGFGTTINIINGAEECNKGQEARMVHRGKYYNKWLEKFGLDKEKNLDCAHQMTFPYGGAGDVYQFWAKRWAGGNTCQLVEYATQYSVLSRDDYKRCVCDIWGNGAANCTEKKEKKKE